MFVLDIYILSIFKYMLCTIKHHIIDFHFLITEYMDSLLKQTGVNQYVLR